MQANWSPLTPLSFLERSALVYPDKTAIIHGERRITYEEFRDHATRLARALQASGIEPGDRVAYLCPNIPEALIAQFAVPLAGAVLVAINTRLAGEEVRYILDHSGAKLLVIDTELTPSIAPIVDELDTVTEVVLVDDAGVESSVDGATYDDLLGRGSDEPLPFTVDDEDATISINYTSGTTGQPKGVMYTHRSGYLNALGEIIHSRHTPDSVYLWTLPMFHCNGWCTGWAVTGIGGTHVCLRAVRADVILSLIESECVTHLNAAPTVLIGLANASEDVTFSHDLVITTAGAPPSPTIIASIYELGADLVHVYGLTETYGPYTVNEDQPAWKGCDPAERAQLKARQGVGMIIAEPVRVIDADGNDVPRDGETMGEVVMRGNDVMKGYYDNPEATEDAFAGGWYHSGDLGVWHPDNYIELRDRAKDVVVSGGENISTIEVEQAISKHAGVMEAAVIGVPDDEWGERPKAFVIRKSGSEVTPDELIEHCRGLIARYKIPKAIEFVDELPKTSTGKIQKFELREKEWAGRDTRVGS